MTSFILTVILHENYAQHSHITWLNNNKNIMFLDFLKPKENENKMVKELLPLRNPSDIYQQYF